MPALPGSTAGFAHPAALVAVAGAIFTVSSLHAGLLYSTDFEDFSVGPDMWAGPPDDWVGTSEGDGVHGIVTGLLPLEGKTAYLGFNEPSSDWFITVNKFLDHDPLTEGTAAIEIESVLGIEDSTNGRRDDFFLSVYNIDGVFLGGLRFSNVPDTRGIWREDGVTSHDTGLAFVLGEAHFVWMRIDLPNNQWRAELDGVPLFTNAPFTARPDDRDLGSVACQWQIPGMDPASYGDNWMLVAECAVWAVPPGQFPLTIDSLELNPARQPVITWTGEPGWTYQVEYSDDIQCWSSDLPDSTIHGPPEPAPLTYTDLSSPLPSNRSYRITRRITP